MHTPRFQVAILLLLPGLVAQTACDTYTCLDTASCRAAPVDGGQSNSVDASVRSTASTTVDATGRTGDALQPSSPNHQSDSPTASSSRAAISADADAGDSDQSDADHPADVDTSNGHALNSSVGDANASDADTSNVDATVSSSTHDAGPSQGHDIDSSVVLQRELGEACNDSNDCDSNACVDGVCCESQCDGVCEACNSAGLCSAVPEDDDACEPITCRETSACVSYPAPKTNNRCVSLGECVSEDVHCVPNFAEANTECGSGLACDGAGKCESVCGYGEVWCDGQCVNPERDPEFCGATDNCSAQNAGEVCSRGSQLCIKGSCHEWTGDTTFAGTGDEPPHLAATPNGDALAAWEVILDGVKSIHFSTFHVATESWDPPELVETAPGYAGNPKVSMSGAGQPICIWSQDVNDGTGAFAVRASSRSSSGTWAPYQTLSTQGERASGASLYGLSSGELVAAWSQQTTPSSATSLYFARHTASGWLPRQSLESWSAPSLLHGGATDSSGGATLLASTNSTTTNELHALRWDGQMWIPQLLSSVDSTTTITYPAIAGRGTRYVATWEETSSSGAQLRMKELNGETWSTTKTLDLSGPIAFLTATIASNDRIFLAWTETTGVVWTTTDRTTGEWLLPKPLASGFRAPTLLSDDFDNVVAFWTDGPLFWRSSNLDQTDFGDPYQLTPTSKAISTTFALPLPAGRMLVAYDRSPGNGTSDLGFNFFR